MEIRPERPEAAPAIRVATEAAFAGMRLGDGTEPRIPAALREAGALTLTLVAAEGGRVLGPSPSRP